MSMEVIFILIVMFIGAPTFCIASASLLTEVIFDVNIIEFYFLWKKKKIGLQWEQRNLRPGDYVYVEACDNIYKGQITEHYKYSKQLSVKFFKKNGKKIPVERISMSRKRAITEKYLPNAYKVLFTGERHE